MTHYTYSIPHPTNRYGQRPILKFVGTAIQFQRHVRGLSFKLVCSIALPVVPG